MNKRRITIHVTEMEFGGTKVIVQTIVLVTMEAVELVIPKQAQETRE